MGILEEIEDLKNKFNTLLEIDETGEYSPNKISRTKKNKKTKEPVEIVSVADELFPYEGTAKEQLNQKIIAKINDMLQGTATLEDLINLIRRKKVTTPESLEQPKNNSYSSMMKQILDLSEAFATLTKKPEAKEESPVEKARKDFRLADKIARYKHKTFNKYLDDNMGYIEGDDDVYADSMIANNKREEKLNDYNKIRNANKLNNKVNAPESIETPKTLEDGVKMFKSILENLES